MIYISFDIGVKNLAVCIIKKTDILEILDWRIIALASSKKEIKGIEDISERIYIEMGADQHLPGQKKNTLTFRENNASWQLLESYNNKTPIVLINKIDLNPNL